MTQDFTLSQLESTYTEKAIPDLLPGVQNNLDCIVAITVMFHPPRLV